jgi:N6-adenosine-specific RNA methylase IME4
MTRYRTIVADPPWQYQPTKMPSADDYARGVAERHYDTLPVSAIAALDVSALADSDAHLYLWITNPILTEQRTDASPLSVVRAWGFHPKAVLTWVKPQIGLGFYFRGCTEHVIFGVRGRAPIPPAVRERNVIEAARGRHSEKPDAFYDVVERVSPGPYLEMFARRARLGWDYAGDGSLGTVEIPGLRSPGEELAS